MIRHVARSVFCTGAGNSQCSCLPSPSRAQARATSEVDLPRDRRPDKLEGVPAVEPVAEAGPKARPEDSKSLCSTKLKTPSTAAAKGDCRRKHAGRRATISRAVSIECADPSSAARRSRWGRGPEGVEGTRSAPHRKPRVNEATSRSRPLKRANPCKRLP